MKNKQYAVLGLGVFGSTVATTLAKYDCEVIAVDKDVSCVERIADEVTKAVVADTTDIEQLKALGFEDIDVAIIAIGTHLEEAVLTTMNVKDLGVPYVIAKAKNKQFSKILEKVGANKVIRAEKDMGYRVAKSLLRKSIVDLVELDDEEYVVLLPVAEEGEEEEGEVVILKLEDTDEDSDEESYVGVDDEEILNKVFQIFKEKYKDDFNFVDED